MSLTLPAQAFNLPADQPLDSSIALIDITGFTLPVRANQRIAWLFFASFTLGATGGFRFQPTAPAGISDIATQWFAAEATTPASFVLSAITQTPFTNAAAVAATYLVKASGSITIGSTAGNFSMQFAQNNSTANPITIKAGSTFMCWVY